MRVKRASNRKSFLRELISLELIIFLVVGVGVIVAHDFYIKYRENKLAEESKIECQAQIDNKKSDVNAQKTGPKYWFHDETNNFEKFEDVKIVLDELGLQQIDVKYSSSITNYVHMEWDLVWSYLTIELIPIKWENLKFYQKVNHIPGIYALLSKSELSTMIPSKHIPKGFLSTQELQAYAAENPNVRFLQKNKDNRGISMKNVSDINIKQISEYEGSFAQVYVEDPFLIEGHKFDISFYVLITSVNPLRIYIYSSSANFRICPLPYDANDVENMDRHIISPTQLDVFDFPPIKKYTDKGYAVKDAFEIFFAEKGVDSEKIFNQAENIIREIILEREHFIIEELEDYYDTKLNFFELIRVDMMLDNNLKLHVIEMNQHPNLRAADRYIKKTVLYQNILFNMFNIVGAGTTWMKEHLKFETMAEEQMVLGQPGILVKPEVCANYPCNKVCSAECDLCVHCMKPSQKFDLIIAYREALHVGAFKRIFPAPNNSYTELDNDYWNSLSTANKHHSRWFIEKCKKDQRFC